MSEFVSQPVALTSCSIPIKCDYPVIPKLIMQTWKTNELPDKWKPTQLSINRYMSDWKYILMTDEMNRNFIIHHFPNFLPYYDAFPYPIQRADAIRYAWLYVHGGLYLDCDF
jgi:mannosyltransferase OCH1-like enzyme